MEALELPVHEYRNALTASTDIVLAETVEIDARGYSPAIGRNEGHDYLDDRILLFDEEQLDSAVERQESSYIPALIKQLRQNYRDYVRAATAASPIQGTISVDLFTDRYQVQADLAPIDHDQYRTVQDARQELEDIDTDRLSDQDRLETSLRASEHIDDPDIADLDSPAQQVSIEIDAFHRVGQDGEAFFIHYGEPAVIEVDEASYLQDMDLQPADWSSAALEPVIESLAERDLLKIDRPALETELEDRSDQIIGTAREVLDQEAGQYEKLATILDETVNEQYHALKTLEQEGDISIGSTADMAKLEFLQSGDPVIDEMLDTLASKDPDEITLQTFDGHGENLATLMDAYEEWVDHSFGIGTEGPYQEACDLVEDMDYNGETIHQFCEETSTTRNDGVFISALINQSDEERIVLPDLSRTKYLGYRNSDTDIIVEGNTGNYPAQNMEGGRLEIKGDVRNGEGWIGDEMTGGTVYVHGRGKLDPHKEGGTIVRSPLRPAFRKRPSNDGNGLLNGLFN